MLSIMLLHTISFPIYSSASQDTYNKQMDTKDQSFKLATIIAEENKKVPLYETLEKDSEILVHLFNKDKLKMIEAFEEYSLVEVTDENEDNGKNSETWQGFVENSFIELDDDDDEQEIEQNKDEDKGKNEKNDNSFSDQTNSEEQTITEDDTYDKSADSDDSDSIEQELKDEPKNKIEIDRNSEKANNKKETQVSKESYVTSTLSSSNKEYRGITLKDATYIRTKPSTDSEPLTIFPSGKVVSYKVLSKYWNEVTLSIGNKKQIGYIHKNHMETIDDNQINIKGVSQKSPTNVRARASTKSNVIKTFPIGSVIDYRSFSKYWYEITVDADGKKSTGYIHKNHTEDLKGNREAIKVVTSKSPTNVRARVSTKSSILDTIPAGEIINVNEFSNHWYETTVMVNGNKKIGYIHKNHVENAESKTFQGIAQNDKTYIRTDPSTKSKALTTVPIGTVLNYMLYNNYWYKVIINVNGKERIGYIHKNHIDEAIIDQNSFWALTGKNPTNVRTNASTNSKVLTSLPVDSLIELSTFSKFWYQVETIDNGKKTTGYIHRNHVTDASSKVFHGIAQKNKTYIRTSASTKSNTLTTVPIGTVVKYQPYNKHWYKALITLNGKKRTGYIHKNHIEEAVISQQKVQGVAQKSPTHVRVRPSTKANSLTTFKVGEILNYKTFSTHWYEITTKVNGKQQTGYIHKKHVGSNAIKNTKYNISLNQALNAQMNAIPRTSYSTMYVHRNALKKSNGKWLINGTNWNVRNKPNSKATIIGKIDERHTKDSITVDEKNSTKEFYKFKVQWIIANEKDTKKYLDPSNFPKGSNGHYQFLVLSKPAGTNITEVNDRILSNKGILRGRASSFIKAANTHNVNELYLISHAMLESGNGQSLLAKGIEVGKDKSGKVTMVTKSNKSKLTNIKKVYNMYGIGAVDKCALECGAIRAYKEGWTSPDKAIVGGAKFIADEYINKGQDTLYKMRWNPGAVEKNGIASHQYATDIGWAEKQTGNLINYYSSLDNYSLVFDVPSYK